MNSGLALYPSKKCSASRKTLRSLERRNSTESATMATASSRVVRRASTTCISDDLATMHTASVWALTRWRSVSSSSALTAARRVEPNATSVDLDSESSVGARAKNSSSFGLAPGHPPSMKVTPRWSSCSATRSLSSTVSDSPSCWEPSRRVVSKTSTADGKDGQIEVVAAPPAAAPRASLPSAWACCPGVSGWLCTSPLPWEWA